MTVPKVLKEAGIQIASGGSAGFVEVCIMHPLDLVKTRLQIQPNKTSNANQVHYTGIMDCMKKMYVQEGITSFWKGILPPILVETPKRAVKFFTFEQYQRIFMFGADKPTATTYALSGLCAGMTEGFLANPFEVVKVSLQSNRSTGKEVPSTWSVTQKIVKEGGIGLLGLNRGLTATLSRNGIFNMIYLGLYNTVRAYMPKADSELQGFLIKVGVGFFAGTVGSLLNTPFDVAKSRMQAPQAKPVKYRYTIQTLNLIYKEEGFVGLYKGLLPKILRLGPGGAIMLVVYDYAINFLKQKYPDEP